jgi:DNA-binding Xre family transcriptional regulator
MFAIAMAIGDYTLHNLGRGLKMSEKHQRLVLIGQRIRAKLAAQGHTQETFAGLVGVTTTRLSRIVSGLGDTIDVDVYERIAAALGMEFNDLLDTDLPLYPGLTGYDQVDELITAFCLHLHAGDNGLAALTPLACDEYRLSYLQSNVAQLLHLAPPLQPVTLAEEIAINYKEAANHASVAMVPLQAWPQGDQTVVAYVRTAFVETKNAAEIATAVPRRFETRYVSTIEIWTLDTAWNEIIDHAAPAKVLKRAIGILGIRTTL